MDENILLLNEFYKIGSLLSTEKNILKLLEIILSSSIKLTSSDAGTIYLVIDKKTSRWAPIKKGLHKGKILKFVITKNASIDVGLEESLSPLTMSSIVGYSAIKGKSLRIDDAYSISSDVEYMHNDLFDKSTGYITKSILSVPMKDIESNVSGVIQLINKKEDLETIINYKDDNCIKNILPYNYLDELIMDSLAAQAAVALQNNILSDNMETLLKDYKEQNNKLVALSKKILISHEEERKRIARDIHDGPAQSIASLSLKLELCKRHLQNDNKDEFSKEFDLLGSTIKSTLKEVRSILYDLKPSFLEDGIVEALINYSDIFRGYTGIKVIFNVSGDDSNLEYYITSTIYRIVQESLTNIAKHSQGKTATIDFDIESTSIFFTISDDGKGFDVEEKRKNQIKNNLEKGFGLEGIRERVSLLRGEFSISSTLGKGTTIKVKIPTK